MLAAIAAKESVWIRSRGGSKTDDAVELAIHLGLRYGNGGWYSCDGGQIAEARSRLKDYSPWILRVNQYQADLCNGSRILFGKYGGKRGLRGPRNHWIISDEEGEIRGKYEIVHGYEAALATTSTFKDAIKLHMGTAKIGSKLQENAQQFPTVYRDPRYCHWVDVEQYQHMPQWWKDNELYCKWTAAGGGVFKPITHFQMPATFEAVAQGIDFNASQTNNCTARVGKVGLDIYVLHEDTFQYKLDDQKLQQYCNLFPTEAESGGWNTTYAPNLRGVSTMSFSQQVKSNGKSIGIKEHVISDMNRGNIYIDPAVCPKIYKHLMAAVWTEKETVEVNDLHYLAALIHACNKRQVRMGYI